MLGYLFSALLAALALGCAPAYAQTSFPTPGGGNVDGKPAMFLNGSNQAVPVTSSAPLPVTGSSIPPAATGGFSTWVGAVTGKVLVSGGAHQVVRMQCDNPGAATAWMEAFDAATTGAVTLGSTSPTDFIGISAGAGSGFALAATGVQYSSGIVVAAVTAFGGASAVSTAVNCSITYK